MIGDNEYEVKPESFLTPIAEEWMLVEVLSKQEGPIPVCHRCLFVTKATMSELLSGLYNQNGPDFLDVTFRQIIPGKDGAVATAKDLSHHTGKLSLSGLARAAFPEN